MNHASVTEQEPSAKNAEMKIEHLPFTVRLVRSEEMLGKAVAIRQSAYARHVPALAERLGKPEFNDHDEDAVILLAESKLDGSPLGTMRIQNNRRKPLALETAIGFPDRFAGSSLVHMSRLGIMNGRAGRVVKAALVKACFLHCLKDGVDHIVIAARSPLDRQYQGMLFDDVVTGAGFVPLSTAGDTPHRIMSLEVKSVQRRWREANYPLYDFFFAMEHPDIDVSEGMPAAENDLPESLQPASEPPFYSDRFVTQLARA